MTAAAPPREFREPVPPSPGHRHVAIGLVLLGAALTGAVVAAALRAPWAAVATVAAAGCLDTALAHTQPFTRWALRWAGADLPLRRAVALLAVTLLAGRDGDAATVVAVGVVSVVCVGLGLAQAAGERVLTLLRRPPVLTRNVSLAAARIPAAPTRSLAVSTAVAGQTATALALAVALSSHSWALPLWAVVAALLSAAPAAVAIAHACVLFRRRVRARVPKVAVDAWSALAPEVLLYFAGRPEESYQVDMWLAAVERLDRRAAVVLRDHDTLGTLGPTSLPVFSVVHNGTVADLPLQNPTVVLFATHSGNNLAMLRRPEARPAFVGHGDSDKPDSMNRYARVYDEVWVAGPLGADRYRTAGIGVRDDAIRETGRPQLPGDWPTPGSPPTVLYAPTWEGWGDDPHHCSLPHVGPALVELLLGADVRVLYRPHPLTGVRNRDVARAHRQVLDLLRRHGGVGPEVLAPPARPVAGGDLLDAARRSGEQPWSRSDEDAQTQQWLQEFWAAAPQAHRILTGTLPGLHESFVPANLLVADISSVMSDWLSTDRAYATVDTRGIGERVLRRRFPAAAGATVLDCGLTQLLEWVHTAATKDPMAAARRRTRARVLGPVCSQPDEQFGRAVTALLATRK